MPCGMSQAGLWGVFAKGYGTPWDCHRFFQFCLFVMSFANNNEDNHPSCSTQVNGINKFFNHLNFKNYGTY